jgi:3-oxoacyl-[acyl-carrier protein] reductase
VLGTYEKRIRRHRHRREPGDQINSVVPGAVMTGRRRSFLDHWATEHGMTVDEAMKQFPEKAGIARYGQPEEIAGLIA